MPKTDEYGKRIVKCHKCGKHNYIEGCSGMFYNKCINCLATLRFQR